ncbi:MAG TPA: hypothetical protein VK808_00360 [Bacteroidia bacterium]|nr:hypothetical protein [Bacteroidia bacterium]
MIMKISALCNHEVKAIHLCSFQASLQQLGIINKARTRWENMGD